jgi:hypothetical protein
MDQSNPEHLICQCPSAGPCSGHCRPQRSPISANADIQNNLPGPMSDINSPSVACGLNDINSDVVKHHMNPFLVLKDISALSRVSKTTQALFQPNRLQMMADKLLLQVMHGEQDKAEVILKIRPDLLMIKGTATDYSGRTFTCTAFQYALWALDTRYMCNMMLDCVPNSPDAQRIQQVLLNQLLAQELVGIEYQLEHRTVREKHYDFTPLLTALKTYVDNYDHWYANSMAAEIEWQWCRVVGLAQRYVPAHVAQHYCNPDESFAPTTPKFNKPKFTRILQFDDRSLNFSKSHWFSPEVASAQAFSGDFGILRGPLAMPRRQTWGSSSDDSHRVSVSRDLSALTALCQVRTKDLEPLKERLKSPLQKPKVESVSSCVIF